MTPLEIADYKLTWLPGFSAYIDPDADIFAKQWCKRNLQKKSWSFTPNARQDDWHKVLFETPEYLESFRQAYNEKYRVKI